MNIMTTGIGRVVAEFVENRLILLHKAGVNLYVILNYGEPKVSNLTGIIYLPIHSFKKARFYENIFYFIKTVVKVILNPVDFIHLVSIAPVNFFYKIPWALERVCFLNHHADIIHIQWLGSVKNLYWVKQWFKAPIIASARGSQITIYPHIDKSYFNHISDCISLADAVHCVSYSMKDAVCRINNNHPSKHIFVNYNGVDCSRFRPAEPYESSSSNVILLSVGTFMWRKNFIAQFQLVLELLRKNINNFKLLIVGGGEQEKDYHQIIHVLGISNNIEVKGYIKSDSIQEIYREGDIYISTSLAEGLSNSVMEACASGLPSIVFNCEGMEELIEDGETGYIVPAFDINALVNNCIMLIRDEKLRKKMGLKAATKMKEQFDAAYHTAEMINHMKIIASNA